MITHGKVTEKAVGKRAGKLDLGDKKLKPFVPSAEHNFHVNYMHHIKLFLCRASLQKGGVATVLTNMG